MSSAAQPDFAKYSSRTARNARTLRAYMALRNQEIAQRIKELREERGNPPQPIVATAVGVSLRTYQNWEGGDAKPEYRNLENLASYFDVSEEFILTGMERKSVSKADGTPDPFAGQPTDLAEQLNRIEQALTDRTDHDEKMAALIEQQNQLLGRQSDILRRIETLVLALPTDEQTEELLRAARGEDQPDPQSTHAPAQSERGSGAHRAAEG